MKCREDLVSTLLLVKKEQRVTEQQISHLRAENQRIENEALKQHKRIEKLMSSHSTGQALNDVRKEIEKSVFVRQLKSQVDLASSCTRKKNNNSLFGF